MRNRHYDLPDIRMLAECVYSAKFIDRKRASRLVDVVCDLVSEQQAETLKHDVFLTDRVKTENTAIYDIIQTINFGKPEPLLAFCRGVQEGAPVDSFATPEPWDMPGYDCPVVMAAGAFIQGSSIELSCDAPMREPFTAYMQGGLTYEAGKIGIMKAVRRLLEL